MGSMKPSYHISVNREIGQSIQVLTDFTDTILLYAGKDLGLWQLPLVFTTELERRKEEE